MEATSSAWITASARTLQNSAIFLRSDAGTARSQRHSRMSGWMPIERSSFTECCVGLVLSSPALGMNGSSVRWMNTRVAARQLVAELADGLEERQALDVADRAADLHQHEVDARRCPTSTNCLMASVTCGITCTVPPR